MSAALQIALVFASVAALLAVMGAVRAQATRAGWGAEVQRKLIHIATGLFAVSLPWLFPERWPILLLLAVTVVVMLVLRLPRFASRGAGAALHGVERRSYGDLLLALAVATVLLISGDAPILYVLPLAILALSDAAAALTGSAYGRAFFRVEDGHKSLEGSVAFFVTAFCLSMICLLVMSDVPRVTVIFLAAFVAAFGALIEADSWRGFDNFFLPAGLCVFLEGHLQARPIDMAGVVVVFLAAVVVAHWAAPRVGISRHGARVYVIAAVLLSTVVGLGQSALPLLALAASALAARRAPGEAGHMELDAVAAVALMSFLWLALGRVLGTYNIELFGLTALAMALGFLALGVPRSAKGLALLLGAAGLGVALWRWLYDSAGVDAVIAPPALLVAAALILGAGLPFWRPGWFVAARAGKLWALALAFPLLGFALHWGA